MNTLPVSVIYDNTHQLPHSLLELGLRLIVRRPPLPTAASDIFIGIVALPLLPTSLLLNLFLFFLFIVIIAVFVNRLQHKK